MIANLSMRLRGLAKLPTAVRYGLATLIVALAVLLLQIVPGAHQYPFLLFMPAILFAAVLLDHGCSAYATLLAALAVVYFVMEPVGGWLPHDWIDGLWLTLFVAIGLAIGAIVEAMRHAIENLSAANAALVHAQAELQQQQSNLFDAVIEGAADPIYVKDKRGAFVHVNSASVQVLGATGQSALGRTDREFLAPAAAEAVEVNDREVMSTGERRVVEERVAVAGEQVRTFLSSKFPWRDAAGQVQGLIGISRDITDRKAAEQALAAADAQKQLLLFDINHRVKNHLQSVVGLLSLTAQRATTLDEARDALVTGSGRLTVLGRVYDRLEVGRGESLIDARSFITDLCDDLRNSLLDDRPIDVAVEAVAVWLESDRAVTLGLAINEVLQNAFKYAFPEPRAGTVRVTFGVEGDDCVLVVRDDGIGFDGAARPHGSGTGRRLLTAMAKQLGGTIAVEGRTGTRVELRFPLTLEAPAFGALRSGT